MARAIRSAWRRRGDGIDGIEAGAHEGISDALDSVNAGAMPVVMQKLLQRMFVMV